MEVPYKIHVVMPLTELDDRFLKIQELIDAKRKNLLCKQKKLMKISSQNIFLDSVKNDYNNYYNYISKQKQDQIKALELLNNYISNLTNSNSLTKHNIEDARAEQSKIIREIKSIKNGLDNIIDNTNYVMNALKEKK
jgi:hypothetical protein